MTSKDLEKYLLQSLNMALGSIMQGETSYTNSFSCKVTEEGFYFLPRLPAGYIIDDELYQKIFLIASAALYPKFTLLKQSSAYFVPMDTNDIHTQRALFFPWQQGISERLVITDLDRFTSTLTNQHIPIMKQLTLNYQKITSIAIAGNSGSGKSYMLTYLLSVLEHISDLIIVDPKFDTPSRWARIHDINVIHPHQNRSKSDFLSEVNENLSYCLQIIQRRQTTLYDDPDYQFEHLTIVIDEVLALAEGVNKAIKDAFFSLLSQIA